MNDDLSDLPRLYRDLADWWPILSTPEDYAEEAEIYRQALLAASEIQITSLLELGSGGGNNASHLKSYFQLTLVDRSPEMLAVSQALNPECEHLQGDMRSVHLGRLFDAVFIHDAVVYMTTEDELRQALTTAYEHLRPGGAALFAPDYIRETFRPVTEHGGHDRGRRSLRYLDWTWDPDPADSSYEFFMVYVLREDDRVIACIPDMHQAGIFSRADWLRLMTEVGFEARALPFEHSEVEPGTTEIFVGRKPAVSP